MSSASSSTTDPSCYHLFSRKKRQHTWLASDVVFRTPTRIHAPFLEPGVTVEKMYNALRGIDRQRELNITQEAQHGEEALCRKFVV